MAITTSVIKSSLGDYATLTLWEADLPADPAVGDGATASIEEAYECNATVGFTINVSNANGADYLVTVASGYRFNEAAGWPNCADVEGLGARLETDNGEDSAFEIGTDNVTVEYLEIVNLHNRKARGVYISTVTNPTVRYCMVHDIPGSTNDEGILTISSVGIVIHHNFVYNIFTDKGISVNSGGTHEIHHNVVFNCGEAGIKFNFCTATVYNNICVGNASISGADIEEAGSSTLTGGNNISSDGVPADDIVWFTVAAEDILEDIGEGTEDLHIKLSYIGEDVSATVGSTDIDGNTVGAEQTIGANFGDGPFISVIKSSLGHYTTLTLWEADLPADPAVGDGQTAEVREAYNANSGGIFLFNISNANSAPFLVTVAEGYRFTDGAGWPSCADAEGQGAYLLGAGSAYVFRVESPYFNAEWLEVDNGSTRPATYYVGSSNNCVMSHFMVHGNSNGFASNTTVIVHNCFFYGNIAAGIKFTASGGLIYNCTVLNAGTNGIDLVGDSAVYNTISFGSGSSDFSGGVGDYNMSSDTTAKGTTTWKSVTSSDILDNVTGGSEDLHMKSSNDGSYEGSDESATIGSLDIDGDTRSDWDIGADEIIGVITTGGNTLIGVILITNRHRR